MSQIEVESLIIQLRQQQEAIRIANLSPCCGAEYKAKYIDGDMFVCATCKRIRTEIKSLQEQAE